MRIKQVILFSILLNSQFCLSQNIKDTSRTYWSELIETNFETKNKDTLKLILSEWASSTTHFIQDSLIHEKDFIKEAYKLFPEFIDALYDNFGGQLLLQFKPEDIYYHLPTSINIQFSNKELPNNLLKYQSEFSGIPIDSLKKYPNAMVEEVTDHQLYKDFLNFDSNHHRIILNSFRPYLKDSTFKITYTDDSFFSKEIKKMVSHYYVENFLEEKGFSNSEIWGSGAWSYGKFRNEYNERQDHLSTFRFNVSNSIKKVVFYNKFKSAIVEVNSNFDSCCPTFYFIFENYNENWVFERYFSLNRFVNCMDHNGDCDFR